jgi:hypothetical protein
MLRSWILPALLAGLLVPAFAAADDPKTPQEKLDEKLTNILNQLASVNQKLEAIEKKVAQRSDLTDTTLMLSDLREEINKLRRETRSAQKPATEFGKMPGAGRGDSFRAASGTFRIINDFGEVAFVEVNGVGYTVSPGMTEIPVPAGTFAYQVFGHDAAPQSRTVEAGKVREIRIFRR